MAAQSAPRGSMSLLSEKRQTLIEMASRSRSLEAPYPYTHGTQQLATSPNEPNNDSAGANPRLSGGPEVGPPALRTAKDRRVHFMQETKSQSLDTPYSHTHEQRKLDMDGDNDMAERSHSFTAITTVAHGNKAHGPGSQLSRHGVLRYQRSMSCDIEDGSTSEHEKWEREAMQENVWKSKSPGSGSPSATSPAAPPTTSGPVRQSSILDTGPAMPHKMMKAKHKRLLLLMEGRSLSMDSPYYDEEETQQQALAPQTKAHSWTAVSESQYELQAAAPSPQNQTSVPRMKRLSLQLTSSAFTTIQHDPETDYDPPLGPDGLDTSQGQGLSGQMGQGQEVSRSIGGMAVASQAGVVSEDTKDATVPERTVTTSSNRRDPMFYKGQPERRSASAHFTLDPQVSIDVDTILQATSPIFPHMAQDSNKTDSAALFEARAAQLYQQQQPHQQKHAFHKYQKDAENLSPIVVMASRSGDQPMWNSNGAKPQRDRDRSPRSQTVAPPRTQAESPRDRSPRQSDSPRSGSDTTRERSPRSPRGESGGNRGSSGSGSGGDLMSRSAPEYGQGYQVASQASQTERLPSYHWMENYRTPPAAADAGSRGQDRQDRPQRRSADMDRRILAEQGYGQGEYEWQKEHNWDRDSERDRAPDRERDRDEDRGRERDRNGGRDWERESRQTREGERTHSKERATSGEREKKRDKSRERDKSKEKGRDKSRDRDKSREWDKGTDIDKSVVRDRDKNSENKNEKRERSKSRDRERKDRDIERERERDRDWEREREIERDGGRRKSRPDSLRGLDGTQPREHQRTKSDPFTRLPPELRRGKSHRELLRSQGESERDLFRDRSSHIGARESFRTAIQEQPPVKSHRDRSKSDSQRDRKSSGSGQQYRSQGSSPRGTGGSPRSGDAYREHSPRGGQAPASRAPQERGTVEKGSVPREQSPVGGPNPRSPQVSPHRTSALPPCEKDPPGAPSTQHRGSIIDTAPSLPDPTLSGRRRSSNTLEVDSTPPWEKRRLELYGNTADKQQEKQKCFRNSNYANYDSITRCNLKKTIMDTLQSSDPATLTPQQTQQLHQHQQQQQQQASGSIPSRTRSSSSSPQRSSTTRRASGGERPLWAESKLWREAQPPLQGALDQSPQSPPHRRRKKLNMRMKSFSLDTPEPPKQHAIDETSKKKSSSFTNACFGGQSSGSMAYARRSKFWNRSTSLDTEEMYDSHSPKSNQSLSPRGGGSPGRGSMEKINEAPPSKMNLSSSRRSLPTNLYVVLYNFRGKEKDDLDLRAGWKVNAIDTSDPDWWKGKANGKVGYFPAKYVEKVNPGEKVLEVVQGLEISEGDSGIKLLKDQIVIQESEEEDGMVSIRTCDENRARFPCPLKYLHEI